MPHIAAILFVVGYLLYFPQAIGDENLYAQLLRIWRVFGWTTTMTRVGGVPSS